MIHVVAFFWLVVNVRRNTLTIHVVGVIVFVNVVMSIVWRFGYGFSRERSYMNKQKKHTRRELKEKILD